MKQSYWKLKLVRIRYSHVLCGQHINDHYHTIHPFIQDSKSHHEKELKAAEDGLSKAKKEAESIVREAKANEQEMQALQLELEELGKSLETQQQQVKCACMSTKNV